MRLRAKVGTLLIRGVTVKGRLIVCGEETPVIPDFDAGRIVMSDTLTRVQRRQVFNRLIGRLEIAAMMLVVTGELPPWMACLAEGSPGNPVAVTLPAMDLSKPDPIVHGPLS